MQVTVQRFHTRASKPRSGREIGPLFQGGATKFHPSASFAEYLFKLAKHFFHFCQPLCLLFRYPFNICNPQALIRLTLTPALTVTRSFRLISLYRDDAGARRKIAQALNPEMCCLPPLPVSLADVSQQATRKTFSLESGNRLFCKVFFFFFHLAQNPSFRRDAHPKRLSALKAFPNVMCVCACEEGLGTFCGALLFLDDG